jgi:hypothetical protein
MEKGKDHRSAFSLRWSALGANARTLTGIEEATGLTLIQTPDMLVIVSDPFYYPLSCYVPATSFLMRTLAANLVSGSIVRPMISKGDKRDGSCPLPPSSFDGDHRFFRQAAMEWLLLVAILFETSVTWNTRMIQVIDETHSVLAAVIPSPKHVVAEPMLRFAGDFFFLLCRRALTATPAPAAGSSAPAGDAFLNVFNPLFDTFKTDLNKELDLMARSAASQFPPKTVAAYYPPHVSPLVYPFGPVKTPLVTAPDSGDSSATVLKKLLQLEGALEKLGKRPFAPGPVDPSKRAALGSLCSFFAATGACSHADKCRYDHRAATSSADDVKELRRFAALTTLKSTSAKEAQKKARALADQLAPA